MQRLPLALAVLALLLLAAGVFVWLGRVSEGAAVAPSAAPTTQATHSAPAARATAELRSEIAAPSPSEEHSELESAHASGTPVPTGAAPAPTIVVEVQVLTDDQPTPGVRVDLEFDPSDAGPFVQSRSLSATTDWNGVASFEVSWYFRSAEALVLAPGGARIAKIVERRDDVERWQVELRLGSARVEGVVHNMAGEPAADAQVWLRCEAGAWFATTYSRADGSYAFDFVAAGFVQLATLTEPMNQTPGHRARLEVAPFESKRVDLGGREPPRKWTGQLRLPSGAPLEVGLDLWAVERTREWKTQFRSAANGAFQVELTPGEYDVFTYGARAPFELGALTLPARAGPFQQDLVPPGRTLRGTVTWSDDGSPVDGRALLLNAPGDERSVTLRQGRFCVFDLADADYALSVHGEQLADAPDGVVKLAMDAGRESILHLRLVR